MNFNLKVAAAAALLAAASAQASVTSSFSVSAPLGAPSYTFDDLAGNSLLSVSGGVIKNDTVINVNLRPLGSTGGYWSIDPTTSSGLISFSTALSSVSFLWGSPDTYNSLDVLLSGGGTQSIVPFAGNGSNSNTRYVTLSAAAGTSITGLSFASSNFAFEVDNLYVTAVPEPETYALMLAGLAAVAFVARRRKS